MVMEQPADILQECHEMIMGVQRRVAREGAWDETRLQIDPVRVTRPDNLCGFGPRIFPHPIHLFINSECESLALQRGQQIIAPSRELSKEVLEQDKLIQIAHRKAQITTGAKISLLRRVVHRRALERFIWD